MKFKFKKNLGFTLVEILAAIVIVAIISIVVVPNVAKYVDKGKTDYNNSLDNQLLLAGKSYYAENRDELPLDEGEGAVVTVSELLSNNMLNKNLVNSKNNDCSDSYVVVRKEDGKYKYTSCLKCGDDLYDRNKAECTVKDPAHSYKIMYINPVTEKKVFGGFATYGESVELRKVKEADTVFSRGTYDFDKWNTKKNAKCNDGDTCYSNGGTITITEGDKLIKNNVLFLYSTWIDPPPTCILLNDPTKDWYNTDVTITAECQDRGSGCVTSTVSYKFEQSGSHTLQVEDKAGQVAKCKSVSVKIDKIEPTVTLSRDTCSRTFNGTASDDQSGVDSYYYSQSPTPPPLASTSWVKIKDSIPTRSPYPKNSLGQLYYLYVKDQAGNIGVATRNSYNRCKESDSCITSESDAKAYYWGGVAKNGCSTDTRCDVDMPDGTIEKQYCLRFKYRELVCNCTIDKVSEEFCIDDYTSAKYDDVTSDKHSIEEGKDYYTSRISYRDADSCTDASNTHSYANKGVTRVCDSELYLGKTDGLNTGTQQYIDYHGFRFYWNKYNYEGFNFDPDYTTKYKEFKLGYWYHNLKDRGTRYYDENKDTAKYAACKFACSKIFPTPEDEKW